MSRSRLMTLSRGTFFALPAELVAQVLSYCDASSLFQVAICGRATNRAFLDSTPMLQPSYTVDSNWRQAYAHLSRMRACKITIVGRLSDDDDRLRVPANTVSLVTSAQGSQRYDWPEDVPLPPRLSFLSTDLILPLLHHLPLRYLDTHVLPRTLPPTLEHLAVQSLPGDENLRLVGGNMSPGLLDTLPNLRHLCLGPIPMRR